MTRDYCWQPWVTMKGTTGSGLVVQPADEWLDTLGAPEVAVRCEVLDIAYPGGTLQLQTGPGADGPWTTAREFNLAEKVTVVLSTEPNAEAEYQADRYVRWAIEQPGQGTWTATFQLTTDAQPSRLPVEETGTPVDEAADRPRALAAAAMSRPATRALEAADSAAASGPRAGTVQPGRARGSSGDGVMQPWTTVVGVFAATGNDIVIAPEENWVDTRGMEQLYVKVEMLQCGGAASPVDLTIEKAISREGPWTEVLTVSNAPSTANALLSAEFATSATYQIESYVRWHISTDDTDWKTCFRINTRQWP